jgi:hypothetical protein
MTLGRATSRRCPAAAMIGAVLPLRVRLITGRPEDTAPACAARGRQPLWK